MPSLPNRPEPGRPIEASWGRSVLDYLRWLTPTSGPGIHLNKTGGNITISARSRRAGGASETANDHPWMPYAAPWQGSGSPPADWGLRLRLIAGTVQGLLASNWNGVFEMSPNVTGRWVWLKVTIDQEGLVSSAEIEHGQSPSVASQPDDPLAIPSVLFQPLWSYDSNATAVTRVYITTNRNLSVGVDVSRPACGDYFRRAEIRML